MTDRHHGYDLSVAYTSDFIREMGPDWLDFCMRAQGFEPPRTGAGYRYLDLGCGQGFHLCLLAATNPQAEFVGIDFHAEHIAHGQGLAAAAGLTNVRFIEADFLDLAGSWPKELGSFDYIALQGILSWISPDLRAAVFQCVANASKSGTVAAFGYNSLPGWVNGVPFQHVAHELGKRSEPAEALERAFTMFARLRDVQAPITKLLPLLEKQLDVLAKQRIGYLAHEFMTDYWTPLWHSSVAQELRTHGFTFVGSAAVAEALLPDSLPPELRAIIVEERDGTFRQDVQDIVINQQFRRDMYCRDPVRIAEPAGLDLDARIYLLTPPQQGVPVNFKTTFGKLTVDYGALGDIVSALADGPKTVAELVAMNNPLRPHPRSIILSMLEANILMVGSANPGPAEVAERFNAAVARAATEDRLYHYIAAAELGSGPHATELGLLMLDAWLAADRHISPEALGQAVTDRLSALDRELRIRGAELGEEQRQSEMAQLAQRFLDQALPHWRRLGVVQ